MKRKLLLVQNQEYFSEKCEKFLFLTQYRISAHNRMCSLNKINVKKELFTVTSCPLH